MAGRFALSLLVLAAFLLALPHQAFAAADTCTFSASGNWTATGTHPATTGCDNGGVIETVDRVVIPAGITITTPPGSTISVSEVQTTGSGRWNVSSDATGTANITLSGCNTGNGRASTSVRCGALTGSTWQFQGAVLHSDLSLENTTPMTSLTSDGNTIRLHPQAALSPAPVAGDWIKVKSGPDKHAWYRISAVAFGGCPTAGVNCRIDVDLYENAGGDEMAYGNATTGWGAGPDFSTVNRRKDTVYFLGSTSVALPLAEAAYFGNPAMSNWDSLSADRCIEVCSWENAATPDYNCNNATVLAADGDYMGWIAYITGGSATKSSIRAEVVASFNDITCSGVFSGSGTTQASNCIANEGATVDRICFDRPLAQITGGAGTTPRQKRGLVLLPRFGPNDTFDVVRMVNLTASNTEWDNGLGFHGATTDIDYAYIKNFAVAYFDGAGLSITDPISNSIIRPKCVGNNTANQNECANGRAINLMNYPAALSVSNLAIIDPATPLNVGPTGTNTHCADLDLNGTCDTGTPTDATPNDGTHGLEMNGGTVYGLYARHVLDDQLTIGASSSYNITFTEPYSFYSDVGN